MLTYFQLSNSFPTCVPGLSPAISVELPQFQAHEETVKIDTKKRAGAGERGMRVLFSALTCFYDAPIIWQATVDRVLVSWNFVESFQRLDLNEMQIKMT